MVLRAIQDASSSLVSHLVSGVGEEVASAVNKSSKTVHNLSTRMLLRVKNHSNFANSIPFSFRGMEEDDYHVVTNNEETDPDYDNGDLVDGYDSRNHNILLFTTLVAFGITIACFAYQAICHLSKFRWPALQRQYLRIIFLAPLYSFCAWLAIYATEYAGYLDLIRSLYESYVLLTFAFMMIIYLGGMNGAISVMKSARLERRSEYGEGSPQERFDCLVCPCFPVCLRFEKEADALNFAFLLVGQFIVVKPVMAVFALCLEQEHEVLQGDKFIKTIVVSSVTAAMVGLLNIYVYLNERIQGLGAGLKFAVLKGAVFFTVWQEVAFHILISEGVIDSVYCGYVGSKGNRDCRPDIPRSGTRTIAMFIVAEMLVLSLVSLYAFSHNDVPIAKEADALLQMHNPPDAASMAAKWEFESEPKNHCSAVAEGLSNFLSIFMLTDFTADALIAMPGLSKTNKAAAFHGDEKGRLRGTKAGKAPDSIAN